MSPVGGHQFFEGGTNVGDPGLYVECGLQGRLAGTAEGSGLSWYTSGLFSARPEET